MESKHGAGVYTRVGEKKGPLVIRGALKRMEEDPSFVYVPMYRVAGPLKEVKSWLKEHHPDESSSALEECYSRDNLEKDEVRDLFEQEVEDANAERAAALHSKNEFKTVNLMVLVRLIKMYEEQKKSQPPKEKKERPVTSSLKDKVKALVDEKKVLDITGMKKKGTDAKKLVLKDGSSKRRLSQDPKDSLYHVVYSPESKSSVSGVRHFLENYGGFKAAQIDKLVAAVKDGSVINIAKGKSPTRSLISPRRSRKTKQVKEEDDVDDLLED